ncbi:MAG: ABC transporter permease subunit [Gammaproteobacteria bacterium]|nr:ABC transporter permease subunit [Gammaproteobacteria bacterium]
MGAFLLRRLATAIPTLLLIATLAFMLLHLTPGGPFDSDKVLVPQIQHAIEARYHLDEPLWRQYLRYLGELAHGDFGPSFQYRNTSVNELIAQGLPVDAAIGGVAMLIAILCGGGAGLVAATRPGGWRDRLPMGMAMLGISIPVFVTAPLLILVFAMRLHWLPSGDWVAGSWRHLLLPALALALPHTAYIARIVRAAAIEALAQPYIRTAIAKGLPTHVIVLRHALRPTLVPLVSFLGPALAGVLTGSIVVEQVFGLPGIGRLFVTGALNRDYTVVTGITVLYGALIIGFNLLVDLCYAWLDPRVRARA